VVEEVIEERAAEEDETFPFTWGAVCARRGALFVNDVTAPLERRGLGGRH
jgi:hypothetical protein